MFEIATRRKPYVLLAVSLVFQILLLAVQVRRPDGARLIRVWAVELLTPAERAGSWALDSVLGGWTGYVGLFRANRENQRLREQLGQMTLRNSELEGRAAEAQRLGALLAFREAHADAQLLAARVIGGAGAGRAIYLDRGERDGVQPNMGVITPQGIVGKVLEVYSSTSQVLLLTDKSGGAGALLAKSRTQGAAKGTGEHLLLLDYVSNEQEVAAGETVLTSGMDRIFPKDLPLGTVVEVHPGNPFKQIVLRPAARLDQLEEVLVLLSKQQWEWERAADEGGAGAPGDANARPAAKSAAPAAKKVDRPPAPGPAIVPAPAKAPESTPAKAPPKDKP
ncbi:MAG TPA: rod shape-determining protein MreC [Candidatus Acidoferrales bacterium]|nr:rod shape-determining protein MreC [Candidatus Acidoferrales bacterium]